MRNKEYLRLWGDPNSYSIGTFVVMADRQIKRGLDKGTLLLQEIGNTKAIVKSSSTRKWFMIYGGWGYNEAMTAMMGAVCGDVAGSVYEHHNIKYKPDVHRLIRHRAKFTDDTVMTCAVADGLRRGFEFLEKEWDGQRKQQKSGGLPRSKSLKRDWYDDPEAERILFNSVKQSMQRYGNLFPHAGYGKRFRKWLASPDPEPYNSWGNGSAMRASYAGWIATNLREAERLGEISASVTHNHPEGIKGAKIVAGCIFLLRDGKSKQDIKEYVEQFYNLDFTLDMIRNTYRFDVSCQGSVPQAIVAFLERENFAEVIANAISIGGDSDTIAAIAGSIAEAIYPIHQGLRGQVIDLQNAVTLPTCQCIFGMKIPIQGLLYYCAFHRILGDRCYNS